VRTPNDQSGLPAGEVPWLATSTDRTKDRYISSAVHPPLSFELSFLRSRARLLRSLEPYAQSQREPSGCRKKHSPLPLEAPPATHPKLPRPASSGLASPLQFTKPASWRDGLKLPVGWGRGLGATQTALIDLALGALMLHANLSGEFVLAPP
jgi:hypothetical protein